ncbi:hypothetical protein BV20DRAFT_627988 [Pilatotrama ljubarskyi]|nr:hypothetical protein BV20DRAFT_627988 [Pilatotrama ljubarskyi]
MSAALVFQCEELASEILEYLSPGPLRKTDTIQYRVHREERQNALACAARVSRAWSKPALRVLWRYVDSVVSLLSLLPPLVLVGGEFDIDDRRGPEYLLSRDITPAEWRRFQDYANYVRELHVDPINIDPEVSPPGPVISSTVWVILSRWCSSKGLCPNLQHLDSLYLSPARSNELILVSPKLRYLHLMFDIFHDTRLDKTAVRSLFSHLRPVLNSLEGLRLGSGARVCIDVGSDIEDQGEETVRYRRLNLAELPALKHLEMDDLPVALTARGLLSCFGKMNLQSLSLCVHLLDAVPGPHEDLSGLRSTLRELRLRGSLEALTRFVGYAAGPALHTLELTFESLYRVDVDILRQAFEHISTTVPENLRRLCLKLEGMSTFATPLDASVFIQPLLHKAHLSYFAFTSSGISIRLNKESLRLMATAWPSLTTLLIETEEETSCYPPMPSFEDVVEFMVYHPDLKQLALPCLNASALPPADAVPESNYGLEIFRLSSIKTTIGRSKKSLLKLALLFDRLFPNLDLSAALIDELDRGTERQSWAEVENYMAALQVGRKSRHRS